MDRDPEVALALVELEKDIRGLRSRISREQQAWTSHLTRSRLSGAHGRAQSQPSQSAQSNMRELSALNSQINGYNTRVRAVCERGGEYPKVTIEDLVEPDEARTISTEMASTFMRRISISARLELKLCGAALQKVEHCLVLAFSAISNVADNMQRTVDEGKQGCLRCLLSLSESRILLLKFAMHKLGMKMARQSLIFDYFEWDEQDDCTSMQLYLINALDPAMAPLGTAQGTEGSQNESSDDNEMDCEDGNDRGEKRQTCITDHFSPLSAL